MRLSRVSAELEPALWLSPGRSGVRLLKNCWRCEPDNLTIQRLLPAAIDEVAMLRITDGSTTTCAGTTRRELLRIGGLSLFGGVTFPRALRAQESGGQVRPSAVRSVILLN